MAGKLENNIRYKFSPTPTHTHGVGGLSSVAELSYFIIIYDKD